MKPEESAETSAEGSAEKQPWVLRVGLTRGEELIEDRVLPEVETIYVGTDEGCHFEVRSRRLGVARFALFEAVDGGYFLRFHEGMGGRLGLREGVKSFSELREGGFAEREQQGTTWRIALPHRARGRVEIGGDSLLFELVPPTPTTAPIVVAPAATAPISTAPITPGRLPAALRGGAGNVDWHFSGFVVTSFLLFLTAFVALESYDPVIDPNPPLIEDRYARFLFEAPEPPPPPPDTSLEPDETEDADAEAPVEAQPASRVAASSAPSSSSEQRAALTEAVGQRVETAIIGAVESIEGSLTDALSMGFDMRVSAADAIAQAEGIGVASGTAGQLLEREGGAGAGGSGERGTLGSLAGGTAAGGQAIATGEVTEQRVRGRVGLAGGGITGGSGDFDASVVRSMISRRIRAIQTCYERALRGSPTAAGRVVIRFTIETSGTVSGASVVENSTGDDGIGACVLGTVGRFRFSPGPEGGSVTVSYPFVFAPQS